MRNSTSGYNSKHLNLQAHILLKQIQILSTQIAPAEHVCNFQVQESCNNAAAAAAAGAVSASAAAAVAAAAAAAAAAAC